MKGQTPMSAMWLWSHQKRISYWTPQCITWRSQIHLQAIWVPSYNKTPKGGTWRSHIPIWDGCFWHFPLKMLNSKNFNEKLWLRKYSAWIKKKIETNFTNPFSQIACKNNFHTHIYVALGTGLPYKCNFYFTNVW